MSFSKYTYQNCQFLVKKMHTNRDNVSNISRMMLSFQRTNDNDNEEENHYIKGKSKAE